MTSYLNSSFNQYQLPHRTRAWCMIMVTKSNGDIWKCQNVAGCCCVMQFSYHTSWQLGPDLIVTNPLLSLYSWFVFKEVQEVCKFEENHFIHHIHLLHILREGFKKKKSMEFSILSKTHPPHSPSMEKKIKITWSKNHF